MSETFTVRTCISRPRADVFAALTQPGELEQYFLTSAGASPLDSREVSWWLSEQETLQMQVTGLKSEQMLSFAWQPPELDTTVQIRFELEDDEDCTWLSISESGWPVSDWASRHSYQHCMLWQRMSLQLKAWLEHHLDLRQTDNSKDKQARPEL